MKWLIFLFPALLACPASAQDPDAQLQNAARFVIYHEIAHVIVYQEELPIFGQEEQAADVGAVLMTGRFHDRETATDIIQAAADMFLGWAPDDRNALDLWTTHRVSEQRYYNILCLFFGENTSQRDFLVDAAELPNDRRENCSEEYIQADRSWGEVLDNMSPTQRAESFTLSVSTDFAPLLEDMLHDDIATLNYFIRLQRPIEIELRTCVSPDAFFDPRQNKITICAQFEHELRSVLSATASRME